MANVFSPTFFGLCSFDLLGSFRGSLGRSLFSGSTVRESSASTTTSTTETATSTAAGTTTAKGVAFEVLASLLLEGGRYDFLGKVEIFAQVLDSLICQEPVEVIPDEIKRLDGRVTEEQGINGISTS